MFSSDLRAIPRRGQEGGDYEVGVRSKENETET